MKRFALVLLLLVACSSAAMSSTIRGTVVAKDGYVLPGVTVTLDGVYTTVTDAKGLFTFTAATGRHTLKAELAGYGTVTQVRLRCNDFSSDMKSHTANTWWRMNVTIASWLSRLAYNGWDTTTSRASATACSSRSIPGWVLPQS